MDTRDLQRRPTVLERARDFDATPEVVPDRLPEDLSGLTIGVPTEGFAFDAPGAPAGTAETAQATREAIGRLGALGATTGDVSFVTGHPAIAIPAAEAGGLPVGVQLVAAHVEEARLLRVARISGRAFGWLPGEAPALPDPVPATGAPV